MISLGSEGQTLDIELVDQLQYSMLSLGSEGFKMLRSSIYWLRYSTFTYGSESKYVFAPSLMVQENTILQILI